MTGNERGQRIAFPCCWYHRLSLRRPKARPPRTGQTDLLFPNARPPTASAVMLSVVRYIAPSPLAASCRCPEESGTVTRLAVCFFRDLQGCDERWLMGKSRSRLRGGGGQRGRGCGYGAARSQCCITCNTAKGGGGGGGGGGACQCRVWRRRHGHARPSALCPCFALSRAPKENKATSPTRQGPSARVSLASQSTERGGAWGGPPAAEAKVVASRSPRARAPPPPPHLCFFFGARGCVSSGSRRSQQPGLRRRQHQHQQHIRALHTSQQRPSYENSISATQHQHHHRTAVVALKD